MCPASLQRSSKLRAADLPRGILKKRTQVESLFCHFWHPKSHKRVQFDVVTTHEHPIIRGNSTVGEGGGPSLTIAWQAQSVKVATVQEAETRASRGHRGGVKVFRQQERIRLLKAAGYTMVELSVDLEKRPDLARVRESKTSLYLMTKQAAQKLVRLPSHSLETGLQKFISLASL